MEGYLSLLFTALMFFFPYGWLGSLPGEVKPGLGFTWLGLALVCGIGGLRRGRFPGFLAALVSVLFQSLFWLVTLLIAWH